MSEEILPKAPPVWRLNQQLFDLNVCLSDRADLGARGGIGPQDDFLRGPMFAWFKVKVWRVMVVVSLLTPLSNPYERETP